MNTQIKSRIRVVCKRICNLYSYFVQDYCVLTLWLYRRDITVPFKRKPLHHQTDMPNNCLLYLLRLDLQHTPLNSSIFVNKFYPYISVFVILLNSIFLCFLHWFSALTLLLLILAYCVHDESCREKFSANFSK